MRANLTGTAFPSCLMHALHAPRNEYSSGNVWMRAPSRTVKYRTEPSARRSIFSPAPRRLRGMIRAVSSGWSVGGDPGRTRTCYLQIRNLSLYPDELRDPQTSHGLLAQLRRSCHEILDRTGGGTWKRRMRDGFTASCAGIMRASRSRTNRSGAHNRRPIDARGRYFFAPTNAPPATGALSALLDVP